MITCPACGKEYQQDDYYEMGEGCELECPNCEAEIVIAEVETRLFWTVLTKADYDEREKRNKAREDAAREKAFAMLKREG